MLNPKFLKFCLTFLAILFLISSLPGGQSAFAASSDFSGVSLSSTPTATSTLRPAPTSTPSINGNAKLQAWVDAAIDLNQFSQRGKLVVHFSAPMAVSSSPTPVLAWPNVNGISTWDETGVTLTFQPDSALKNAGTYTFFLDPALRSANGKSIQDSPEWVARIQNGPKVLSVSPSSGNLAYSHPMIEIRFDQEMNTSKKPMGAFTIEPSIAAEITWKDKRTLQVNFKDALKANQRYDLTLRGAGQETDLLASDGSYLAEDYRWFYWLAPLEAKAELFDAKNLDVTFNYPFDRTKNGTPFVISPAIPGVWEWLSNMKLRFTANDPIPAVNEYTLSLKNPLISIEGFEFASLPETTFTGLSPIHLTGKEIVKSEQGDEFFAESDLAAIRLEFTAPIDHPSAEKAFSLTPFVPGKFTWEKDSTQGREILVYELGELLKQDTPYTVKIDTSVKNAQGGALIKRPWAQNLQLLYYDSTNVFGEEGDNIQVMDASGPRHLQISGGDIDFSAYSFELIDFAKLYAEHYHGRVYNGVRDIPIPNDLKPAATWTNIATREVGNEGEKEKITETTLPGDMPPGLYVVNAQFKNKLYDQLFLVITRNTLVVKNDGTGLFVWLTDINGTNVPDAEVRVYSSTGEKIREGLTDENGQYRVSIAPDSKPMLVAARVRERGQPDDITLAGFVGWNSGGYYYYYGYDSLPEGQAYLTYLYTERPIYRPGQSVNFKALIRKDNDVRYSLPDVGLPVKLRVLDSRKNTVESFEFQTNKFGTINGSFNLSEGAMLGTYEIESDVEGVISSQTFKVEDYRKPDYQVKLTSLQPEKLGRYVRGDEVKVQVNVAYYFGEPLANANLQVKLYRYYEMSTGTASAWVTDKDGNATISFAAPYDENQDYSYGSSAKSEVIRMEVTVDDGSNQAVTGVYRFTVFSSAEEVRLKLAGYYHQPDEPFSVTAQSFDLFEKPLAGRKLTLTTRRWSYTSYEFKEIDQTFNLTTDAQGQASQEIKLPSGYHKLTLSGTDEQGNEISIERWVYIFKDKDDWFRRNRDRYLEISTEKDSYKPYEKARIAIESTFSGPALLSFERGSVINTKLIELTAPLTIIETNIIPEHAPNVYITVNAWQPAGDKVSRFGYDYGYYYETQSDSYLRIDSTEIQVDASTKALDIQIVPDKQVYVPGETLSATIQVRDAGGKPVLAELSLAVVDEAIYALASDSMDIFEAFYGLRAHSVRTSDSMAPYRILMIGGRGGGGGDDMPPEARTDFSDTSAWLPVIETDANGQAKVSFKLPDNTTSWRLSAKAITLNHLVGQTHTNVETKKEVFVRPVLPRILTNGDQATLTAFVHNYSPQSQTLTVSLSAPGLEITDPVDTKLTLKAGEVLPVKWQVRVKSAKPTEATFTAQDAEGVLDAIRLPLALQPAAARDVQNQSGEFTGTLTLGLPLPDVDRETSQVHLTLSRSMSATLLSGLEYLIGYPYGCVEQTMSRALPNAVVGRAAEKLGIGGPEMQTRLPPLIKASISRLYGLQHYDGGWGWWTDDVSDTYQTAWVLFGLGMMQDAGYSIEPKVIERGAEWLKKEIGSKDSDIRTEAYALYSLALVGKGDLKQTQALVASSLYQLDPFSQAALAMALNRLGDKEQAQRILDLLSQEVFQKADQAYWPQPSYDGEYHSKTMSSTIRTTAMILLAYSEIDPQHKLIPGIVKYLAAQRRGASGWGTTNETSITILALTNYLVIGESEQSSTSYEVLVNGKSLFSGILNVGKSNANLDLPLAELNLGVNTLVVKTEGNKPVYFDLSTRYDLLHSEVDAAGKIPVTRRYLNSQTNAALDPEKIQAGQLVKVELNVVFPENAYYLAVEDYLPGGLEALNEGLSATNDVKYDSWGYEGYSPSFWEDYGYNYKEIRGDRVVFFITHPGSGKHTFTYYARATTPGEFLALPVQVYAMYDLTLWGRSASAKIDIQGK